MKKIEKLSNNYYRLTKDLDVFDITPMEYHLMMAGVLTPNFESKSMKIINMEKYRNLVNRDLEDIKKHRQVFAKKLDEEMWFEKL